MKQRPARIAAAALLLAALTACGTDSTGTSKPSVGADSSAGDTLQTDPATGTRYTGRETDRVVRYGNGYGNTNADKTLHPPTALRGGLADRACTAATAKKAERAGESEPIERSTATTYERMLNNARVHDTDGFLLDGENAADNTLR